MSESDSENEYLEHSPTFSKTTILAVRSVLQFLEDNALRKKATEVRHSVQKVLDFLKDTTVRNKLERRIRKSVTGNENVRFSDWKHTPPAVKLGDQILFFLGMLSVNFTQAVFHLQPGYFWIWYMISTVVLLANRTIQYLRLKWQYFLIDYCYFCNLFLFVILILNQFFSSDFVIFSHYLCGDITLVSLLRLCFCMTTGPLIGAVWAWRNSMVFHDIDKVTSIAVHLMPNLCIFCLRWEISSRLTLVHTRDSLNIYEWLITPCLGYFVWQILYLIKTEILDAQVLKDDPKLETSVRWLSRRTHNNSFSTFCINICRKIGLLRRDENLDGMQLKGRLIFMFLQLCFTLVWLPLSLLAFKNYYFHAALIIVTYFNVVWNGAKFYIRIFAVRYQVKFASPTIPRKKGS